MNSRMLAVVFILCANATPARPQPGEFPAQLSWQVQVPAAFNDPNRFRTPKLGPVWQENGEERVIVIRDSALYLYSEGRLVWNSGRLPGYVYAVSRVDFGLGDGPELVCMYRYLPDEPFSEPETALLSFRGENFEGEHHDLQFAQWRWSSESVVNFITHFPDASPDSNHTIWSVNGSSYSSNGPNVSYYSSVSHYKYGGYLWNEDGAQVLLVTAENIWTNRYQPGWDENYYTSYLYYLNQAGEQVAGFYLGERWARNLDVRGIETFCVESVTLDTGRAVVVVYRDANDLGQIGIPNPQTHGWDSKRRFYHTPEFSAVYRPHPDSSDSYLILVSGSEEWMGVVDLETLGEVYTLTRFRRCSKGLSVGDFNSHQGAEMATLTDDTLYFYQLGDLSTRTAIPELPAKLSLASFPNPFNSSTTINYSLSSAGWTVMDVVDVTGRRVERLSQGWQVPGNYTLNWNPKGLAAGSYFIGITSPGGQIVRGVELVR